MILWIEWRGRAPNPALLPEDPPEKLPQDLKDAYLRETGEPLDLD